MNTTSDKPKPGPSQLREKFAALSGMIDESDDAPTGAAEEVYVLLKTQAEEQLTRLHHLASEDINSLNRLARTGNIPAVVV